MKKIKIRFFKTNSEAEKSAQKLSQRYKRDFIIFNSFKIPDMFAVIDEEFFYKQMEKEGYKEGLNLGNHTWWDKKENEKDKNNS